MIEVSWTLGGFGKGGAGCGLDLWLKSETSHSGVATRPIKLKGDLVAGRRTTARAGEKANLVRPFAIVAKCPS